MQKKHGIVTLLDASLLQDNLYFIKTREEAMKDKSIREITRMIADLFDIVYFSARKFGFGRGGGIMVRDEEMFHAMEDYITMFEGFLTYGGMSVKEMEALIIGFEETMDMDIISQGPQFINHCVTELDKLGVPMVTPGGGLGAHIDARQVVDHIPAEQYPAGSLVAALYLCGGIRGMERGTLSEERNADGTEHIASVEMVRLAFPRRVFTLSQTEYVIDRVKWLYDHRHLIGGLRFVHEPKTLRFFTGKLEPVSDWPEKLVEAYIADFGEDQLLRTLLIKSWSGPCFRSAPRFHLLLCLSNNSFFIIFKFIPASAVLTVAFCFIGGIIISINKNLSHKLK